VSRIEPLDPAAPDPAVLREAAAILRAGGLVAFPTETVYGLGAAALDEAAVRRIFVAKGRPAFNPLIAHVADVDGARALARSWPEAAERLAAAFWPGPLTLVVPKQPHVPDLLTAGLPSVALRVPAHPVAAALLREAGIPVAAPSANRFTQLSPTRAEHVARGLGDRVELILDGGATSVGIESTVVDLCGERPLLLRPGSITQEELEAVIGPVVLAGAVTGDTPRPAPGMVERHYAPRARLLLFAAPDGTLDPGQTASLHRAATEARRVGALLWSDVRLPAGIHRVERMPAEAAPYAAALYSALHDLDEQGCDLVLVQQVPDLPPWHGVRDRLRRAAHPA
jgi:L-threonylcarbamoyladenylate synthase